MSLFSSGWWSTDLFTGKKYTLEEEKKKVSQMQAPVLGTVGGAASLGTKMFGVGTGKTIFTNFPWKTAAAVGGGALAGYGISSVFGKEKKQEQQQQLSQQQQPIQITKTISPVTTTTNTNTYANTYQIAENSPGAYLGMEKKDAISTSPSVGVSPAWNMSPSQAASQGASQKAAQSDMGGLIVPAAIVGIALIASGYLKGRKGRK